MSYENKIAFDTNCPLCRAGLYQVRMVGWRDCKVCVGTGRDPIPWAELFTDGRSARDE